MISAENVMSWKKSKQFSFLKIKNNVHKMCLIFFYFKQDVLDQRQNVFYLKKG